MLAIRPFYQQDGTALHYGRQVREYLNKVFPERWIGKRGTIEWPPRTSDPAPHDYFLWGYLKSKVYLTKLENFNQSRRLVLDEAGIIPRDYLIYQQVIGQHCEPLI